MSTWPISPKSSSSTVRPLMFVLPFAFVFGEVIGVSCWAAAVRTLFGNPTATPVDAGWPLRHPVLASVLWCLAILAVVAPATLRAYRRRTTG